VIGFAGGGVPPSGRTIIQLSENNETSLRKGAKSWLPSAVSSRYLEGNARRNVERNFKKPR
jgi:hypothetical protein